MPTSTGGGVSFRSAYESARDLFSGTEWDTLTSGQQVAAIYSEMRRLDAAAVTRRSGIEKATT
jgi:hypothetical protein